MKDTLEFLQILSRTFPASAGTPKPRIELVNDNLVVTLFQNDRFYSYDLEAKDYGRNISDILDQIIDIHNNEKEIHGLTEKETE